MSYGWLTEQTLIPKPSKKINVDSSSLVDLKVIMMSQQNQENQSKAKPHKRIFDPLEKVNKNVNIRSQKDTQELKDVKQSKYSLQKKAKLYEKLNQKGHNIEKLLIDFDKKKHDNMTDQEREEYEKERERYYRDKHQELQEIKESIITKNFTQKNSLNQQFQSEEKERIEWEQQAMKELEQDLDEEEAVKEKKNIVQQSYDKIMSKEEKEELVNVITEQKQEQLTIQDIKRKRQEAIDQRKDKLRKLQCK